MRKKIKAIQIFPFFYKRCYLCDYAIKFEKMWCLLLGIGKIKQKVYVCDKCCPSEKEALKNRDILHNNLMREYGNE